MGLDVYRIGSRPFYALDMTCRWVTWNGTKILYLPLEFRPDEGDWMFIAVKSNTVAMANSVGRVTILQFT